MRSTLRAVPAKDSRPLFLVLEILAVEPLQLVGDQGIIALPQDRDDRLIGLERELPFLPHVCAPQARTGEYDARPINWSHSVTGCSRTCLREQSRYALVPGARHESRPDTRRTH